MRDREGRMFGDYKNLTYQKKNVNMTLTTLPYFRPECLARW